MNETFVYLDTLTYSAFSAYDVYVSKAVKLSQQGRYSGGVMVFVRKELVDYVRKIDCMYENVIVLEIDNTLLGTDKHVMLICTYVHPYDSKYWNQSQHGFGLEILEQCLIDLHERFEDFYVMVCGDLNARTGCENAIVNENVLDESFGNTEYDTFFCRRSDDKEITNFGKALLELCSTFECVIANGLSQSGFDDSLTYVSSTGGSMIDYFLVSYDFCFQNRITSLKVLSLIDSSHFPVCITVDALNETDKQVGAQKRWVDKRMWNRDLQQQFIESFQSDEVEDMCSRAMTLIDFDVNQALSLFTDALLSASDCMMTRVYIGNSTRDPLWFDKDCRQLKMTARHSLSTFRKTKQPEDRLKYVNDRKIYKAFIKKKKLSFKREKAERLASLGNDSKSFWKEVKQLSGKRKNTASLEITDEQWFNHFKNLFNDEDVRVNENILHDVGRMDVDCDNLNMPITENEVFEAIRKLKNGKACGVDNIMPEMLKLTGNVSIGFMTKLFNVIFDEGIYPDEWSKAIIVPIFKKGDKNETNNYRGVSLLSLVSKCYTAVLNKRLVNWIDVNEKLTEAQAGFRKGYSTFDHIFTLNAIVEKTFSKKGGKLYACFIDLKKAFDSVQRQLLFDLLQKNGIHGKFVTAITAIYRSVLSCVKIHDNRLTQFFDCPVGLRQGCILSPELFSIFINEIASAVDGKGMHGIQLLPGLIELFILLFADDIVLLSDTARGLQNQINILNDACKNLSLNINKEKTKVMVFRKGGFLAKHEKWLLDGNELEVVNEYTYLGFVFTTKMSLQKGVDALAVKGRRACVDCVRHIGKLTEMSKSCFFKIFDTQVQPVVLYASEMWGLHRLDNIEKVHTFACKRFLKIPLKVPNKFVYGETGRFPLYINSSVRCIKYWLKILRMDLSRLPRQAYTMLITVDDRGKSCWVTLVRNTLFSLGFGYAWLNQGVGCENSFLSLFKQRMKDMYMQEWSASVMEKDMYGNYRMFKTVFESERYFEFLDLRCFRDCLIKLRVGVLPINGSSFKRMFNDNGNFKCKWCNAIEDEFHFIHVCPHYEAIRKKYLNDVAGTYLQVLNFGYINAIRKLAMYIFYALRKRQEDTI